MCMSLKKKLESLDYVLEESDIGNCIYYGSPMKFLIIRKKNQLDSQGKMVFCNTTAVCIGCGTAQTLEQAKESAAAGVGIITTGEELYRSFYAEGKSDRDWALMKCPYSERTFDAIESEKKRLHLLRTSWSYQDQLISLDDREDFLIGINVSAQIGKVPGNTEEWCFQSCTYYADDTCCRQFFFDRRPSVEDAENLLKLEQIIDKLKTRKIPEEFTCWECGLDAFWLDCGRNIYECAQNAEEKYCGC